MTIEVSIRRRSAHRFMAIFGMLMLLTAASSPAAAQTDSQATLNRTAPGHLTPVDPITRGPPLQEPLRRPQSPLDTVVYRLPWPRSTLQDQGVVVDRALTTLCRRGRFTQRSDGLLRVALPDGWLGLAFGDGRNLQDARFLEPEARREREELAFLFQGDGTTNCVVRAVARDRLIQFAFGGRR